jgi:protein-disulfide isomerase
MNLNPLSVMMALSVLGAPAQTPTTAPAAAVTPTPAPAGLDLSDTPFKGPADAPIKVVEYSDFLCPFCKQVAHAFSEYLPHTEGRVAIYYKFYPWDDACGPNRLLHPGACWLSFGGVCAQQQGKFWPYHDKVFAAAGDLSSPDRAAVLKLGVEAGADEAAFGACLDSPRAREDVSADIAEGTRLGVHSTPAIFVNNRALAKPSEFLEAVDAESKRLGLGPMPTGQ